MKVDDPDPRATARDQLDLISAYRVIQSVIDGFAECRGAIPPEVLLHGMREVATHARKMAASADRITTIIEGT